MMRDQLVWALRSLDEGHAVAHAIITGVTGSAPRGVGTLMFVRDDGAVIGSLSGGCVERDVYERCLNAIVTNEPVQWSYPPQDEKLDPFAVGLTCGGAIDVLIAPTRPDRDALATLVAEADADHDIALAVVVEGPDLGHIIAIDTTEPAGGSPPLVERFLTSLRRTPPAPSPPPKNRSLTSLRRTPPDLQRNPRPAPRVIVVERRRPAMYIFGVSEFCSALASVASSAGYRTTVCDPRSEFVTRARFPDADELVVADPVEVLTTAPIDERTAICCMTHDRRWDVPLVSTALQTRAGYIGVMGSHRAIGELRAALIDAGAPSSEIERVAGPIGLDLGGRDPLDVAVAIVAEITLQQHGGSGERMSRRARGATLSP